VNRPQLPILHKGKTKKVKVEEARVGAKASGDISSKRANVLFEELWEKILGSRGGLQKV
jgi:hypothetical protein